MPWRRERRRQEKSGMAKAMPLFGKQLADKAAFPQEDHRWPLSEGIPSALGARDFLEVKARTTRVIR